MLNHYLGHFGEVVEGHVWTKKTHANENVIFGGCHFWVKNPEQIAARGSRFVDFLSTIYRLKRHSVDRSSNNQVLSVWINQGLTWPKSRSGLNIER